MNYRKSMIDLIEYIGPLKKIIVSAGEAICTIYDNPSLFNTEYKKDQSPLTKADQLANEIICKGLIELNEDIPIISEENKEIPFDIRREFDYCWMVDPLDGTKEFIKRNDEFTVNIALIHKGESILGMVYVPVKKELYFAVKNKGAFFEIEGMVNEIKASTFSIQDEKIQVVSSRSHLSEDTIEYLSSLNNPIIVPKGSSLKFLTIAEGNAQVYPRLGPTMEWDTAAAHCILVEAGGSILTFSEHLPLRYNKESLLNPHFIAYGNLN